MNGDLSRVTFNPLKHYTRVVLQQGRVQLDADLNEQTAILLHYLQTLAADLIGPDGGPKDIRAGAKLSRRNCGFALIGAGGQASNPVNPNDMTVEEEARLRGLSAAPKFFITPGHYYVDGLLCENDLPANGGYFSYGEQPYWQPPKSGPLGAEKLRGGFFLLYLDVWEYPITALEDPNIREVALGGADTAARAKLIWQVKFFDMRLIPANQFPTAATARSSNPWLEIVNGQQPKNRGLLKAKAKLADSAAAPIEPCVTAPEARYRGEENQLYRVEIHQGGKAGQATFKWSRDNGSVVAAYSQKDGDNLIVSGFRDSARWFEAGQWVEITHDGRELLGKPGILARLAKVDGETLTIDPKTASENPIFAPTEGQENAIPIAHTKVRRWNQKQTSQQNLSGGAILINESNDNEKDWIELEHGIVIQFQPVKDSQQYRTGDYWLIPARVATGDVEWPGEEGQPEAVTPHGVVHHYAPLALVSLGANGEVSASGWPSSPGHSTSPVATRAGMSQ